MFKNYTSNDNLLLPPCLGDFIPQNDPVRVVHRIIEQINLEELYRRYSPKGCSAYHPRMMLQILVYAYLRNIYSSRRIEEFCRNDIRFMWLTGNVTPDHNTINRFRSSRLKDVLKTIFATIVKFLVAEGLVSLDVACTDGTKMEADANRYTFVWGKSIHTRISKISEQLEEIWRYTESVTKQELRDSAPITYQDITPEKVEKALCQIDDALNGVDADRKMKSKVRRVRKSWPEQLRKYESQGKILDGRIDIDDIRLVINFDVPHYSEDYVHRIGRTARANNDGVALTFVSEKEQSNFKSIENFLEKEIYKIPIPTELGEAPEYKPRSFSNKGGNYSKRRNFKGKRNNGGGKGNNRPSPR